MSTKFEKNYGEKVAATSLVALLGVGAIAAVVKSNTESEQHSINYGCKGSQEVPVTSGESLELALSRISEKVKTPSGVSPSDIQLRNSVANLNLFGLADEADDVMAGKVPKGRSVLLGPEWCPDPTPRS